MSHDAAKDRARADLMAQLAGQVDPEAIQDIDQRCIQAAHRCVELWHAWWIPAGGKAPHPLANEMKMRITYPLAMHTLSAVELALTVVDNKPWVAAGIARIAFEHALAAQWVLLTDGGEDDIVEWMQHEADKRSQSFYEGLGKPEEYEALAATTRPKPPYNVYNACTRFAAHQAAKLFYDIYRNLSEGAHPSIGSLMDYLDYDPVNLVVRHREPTGTLTCADHTATGLACAALWALDAVEELNRHQTRLARLRDIGGAAELPFSLRASDTKPHLQPPV